MTKRPNLIFALILPHSIALSLLNMKTEYLDIRWTSVGPGGIQTCAEHAGDLGCVSLWEPYSFLSTTAC